MSKQKEILRLINMQIASLDGAIDGLTYNDFVAGSEVIAKSDIVFIFKEDKPRMLELKDKVNSVFVDIEIIKSEYSQLGIRAKAIEEALARLINPAKNSNNF